MKIVLASISLLLVALWLRHPGMKVPDRIGRPMQCAKGSLFEGEQAEVLAYGLEDPRGLIVSGDKVYVADDARPILVFDFTSGKLVRPGDDCIHGCQKSLAALCPDGQCGNSDPRGLTVWDDHSGNCEMKRLIVAEHGRAQILQAALDTELAEARNPEGMEELTSPEGIWIDHSTMFVTEDVLAGQASPGSSALIQMTLSSPADKSQTEGKNPKATETRNSQTKANEAKNSKTDSKNAEANEADAKTAQSETAVPGCKNATANEAKKPKTKAAAAKIPGKLDVKLLIQGLVSPSGLVSASATGPIFVAERFAKSIAWGMYRSRESPKSHELAWFRDGYLANVPNNLDTSPVYLGVAIWRPPTAPANAYVILAAGPDALYAFGPSGSVIGRIDFGRPVRGVNVVGNTVYLTVGSLLCRIQLLPRNLPQDQMRLLTDPPDPKGDVPHALRPQSKAKAKHPHPECPCQKSRSTDAQGNLPQLDIVDSLRPEKEGK